VAGICATVAAAVVWGVVVYWMDGDPVRWHPKLHLVGSMWIGFAASLAIVKATGKATASGRILAMVLAFAGKMLADSIFFALMVASQEHRHWSWPLQSYVMSHLLTFKTYTGWHKLVFGGDVLLSACVGWLPWIKPPQFKIAFEPLMADSSATPAAVQQPSLPVTR
jgi:hypothetical protein